MYKGRLVHTITEEDVARPHSALCYYIHNRGFDFAKLWNAMGSLLACDIGKQVYEVDGIYYVENDEQKERRLRNESCKSY